MKVALIIYWIAIGSFFASPAQAERYTWKYVTTGHRLVQLEEQYSVLSATDKGVFYDPMYQKLDGLIDAVFNRLRPFLVSHPAPGKVDVSLILGTIDSVLTEQYFLVCIKMDKLSDALSPKLLQQFTCHPYLPGYRRSFVEQHRDAKFFGIDCDLGAFLYLSVGEVLHFPIRFVEVPDHNFVRWEFSDGSYLDWDNNSAGLYTDDDYRHGATPTESQAFGREEELRNHFLQSMSDQAIRGYYLGVIAIGLSHAQRYKETEQLYLQSLTMRPYDALSGNNLSWMYLTVPEFNTNIKYQEAYELSRKVDSLVPTNIEYRDTYSCACAAAGLFDKAIEVEKTARKKQKRLDGYKKKKNCLELGETIW